MSFALQNHRATHYTLTRMWSGSTLGPVRFGVRLSVNPLSGMLTGAGLGVMPTRYAVVLCHRTTWVFPRQIRDEKDE